MSHPLIDSRIRNGLIMVVGAILSVDLVHQALSGISIVSAMRILVILSPFIACLLLIAQPYWVALVIAAFTLNWAVPVPLLDRFTVGYLIVLAVLAMATARMIIQHNLITRSRVAGFVWLGLAALIVMGRFAYDRPLSARVGTSGGLGLAIYYPIAFWGLWIMRRLAAMPPERLYRNLRVAVVIAGVNFLLSKVLQVFRFGPSAFWMFFESAGWLIVPFGYAWFLARREAQGRRVLSLMVAGVMVGVLLLAVASPYRSRIYFATGAMFAVAFIYRSLLRHVVMLALMGAVLAGFLAFGGLNLLPPQMLRPLSTLVEISDQLDPGQMADLNVSGEMGWKSGFRAQLWTLGIRRIRESPWFGVGMKFQASDLVNSLSAQGINQVYLALAMSGGFHNSLLALAVACGLPAALFFVLGSAILLITFMRTFRNVPAGVEKVAAASLAGTTACWCGQCLMNGGSRELATVCLLFGIMAAMLCQHAQAPTEGTRSSASNEAAS